MPDILIRGMEMPESCADCPICYDMMECSVSPLRFWNGKTELEQFEFCNERHPSCPLVELPPHGNLIDADSLADDLLYDAELAARALDDTYLAGKEREYAQSERDIKQNCAYYVSHSPVIVPASEEEDANG